MTLISSSVPHDTFYSINDNITQNNSTTSSATEQALSWLQYQPATVSTPASSTEKTFNSKYRTLASIQAQTLQQQHLHLLNNSDNLSP
ncbi:hypothetical protein BGX24_003789, partial [Mortierella sp. AD032]